jgi:hypothetical protein
MEVKWRESSDLSTDWGTELHIINDPLDKLPIPQIKQLISIGQSQMLVESVALAQSSTPSVYDIYVQAVSADF